jgi:hypothetical protein
VDSRWQGEGADLGEGFAAGDALDATVERGGVGDGFLELGLAFLPLLGEGALLGIELLFQAEEGFDNGFEVLAEADGAEVLVEDGHFVGAVGLLEAGGCCGDEALAEGGGERGFANPDAFGLADAAQAGGRAGGDDDGEVGLGFALVLLELVGPVVGPVRGALGFPEDGATIVAGMGADALQGVRSALAFFDFRDFVEGEGGAEVGFGGILTHDDSNQAKKAESVDAEFHGASIKENVSIHAARRIPGDAVLILQDFTHPAPDIVAAAHTLDGRFLFRAAFHLADDRPDAGIVLDRVVEFGTRIDYTLRSPRLLDSSQQFLIADGSSVGIGFHDAQNRNSNCLATPLPD